MNKSQTEPSQATEKQSDGRVCPKCGFKLGQKNLCPVCDSKSEKTPDGAAPAASETGATQDRFQQYLDLKKSLADNPKDFTFVLRTVRTIQGDYADYFRLDYISFYAEMYQAKCPFAILAALMDPEWNARYQNLLKCEWKNKQAKLLSHPMLWSPFLLADNSHRITRNVDGATVLNSYSYSSDAKLTEYRTEIPVFFEYEFNPFSLKIWGEDYDDSKDKTYRNMNSQKPIKLESFFGFKIDGWQELVPAGKRVLILFLGKTLETVDAREREESGGESGDSASSTQQAALDFTDSDPSHGLVDHGILTTYDGLKIRQKENYTTDLALEHTILYMVEP